MYQNSKVSVVIPTLNEEKGILNTLNMIPKFVDEVVIVDGNSKDKTREVAQAWGAKVILEPRKGYGRAFKTGFENTTGELIATADGDGTYPIELLPKVLDYLFNQNLEFISCSRFPLQDSSSMHRKNYLGNLLMTKAASTLWFHPFSDILSGMWVFKKSSLKGLHLQSDSWNFSEEIKLEAFQKLKEKFGEFHIPYRERLGETKLSPWKVGFQNICYMLLMRSGTVRPARDAFKRPYEPYRNSP